MLQSQNKPVGIPNSVVVRKSLNPLLVPGIIVWDAVKLVLKVSYDVVGSLFGSAPLLLLLVVDHPGLIAVVITTSIFSAILGFLLWWLPDNPFFGEAALRDRVWPAVKRWWGTVLERAAR